MEIDENIPRQSVEHLEPDKEEKDKNFLPT